jgi:Bacterial TSP3 repeat
LAEFLTGNNPIIFTPGGLVDLDGDELTVGQEALYGSNLNLADTNGDGLNDGVSAQAGINPASLDSDNDGLTNVQEIALGTNPLIADTDGDGVLDSADAFPWDSSRTLAPPPTAGDTSPPMITITTPEGATEL